jgi:phosphopantothenoylcysteine decarboxylase/phosphopantothenate--cysteine ligase
VHPSERILGASSRLLAGKTVVLGVTGSIAAVRSVELARELLRHGARVVPVMTREATRIVHPNALEFATGVEPIVELSGAVEHVQLMGSDAGGADLLLVAPCTANTLSKMAHGIDDSPVTTFFSTGALRIPTLVAPAMHETMQAHPFLVENEQRLRRAGVRFVEPTVAEGKAKLAEPETIVEHVLRLLGPRSLEGKRVLVIAGATQEPIDDMRVVSNRSSGATGVALAREAWRAGADAELWAAHVEVALPDHVPTKRFGSVEDLLALAPQAKGFDAVLVPAALSDYAPEPREGKVPSDRGDLTLRLKALPKALDELRKHAAGVLVPFKAEARVTEVELVERARASLRKRGAPFVVANLLSEVSAERARVLLVDERSATPVEGTKDEVARAVVERLARERS